MVVDTGVLWLHGALGGRGLIGVVRPINTVTKPPIDAHVYLRHVVRAISEQLGSLSDVSSSEQLVFAGLRRGVSCSEWGALTSAWA